MNVDIDGFDCEELRTDLAALKTDYQKHYGHMDDYSIGIGKALKLTRRVVSNTSILSRIRVGYLSVLSFEDHSASGS
jgi:hypothetical protein